MILPRVIVPCLALVFACPFAQAVAEEATTQSPASAATYANPILTAGNPADPHVILVDGMYYLYPTTHGRGYDVWTSQDLVHWDARGSVFDDPRRGAWAPDVFHNSRGDGKFYLYYTDNDTNIEPSQLAKQIGVAVADGPLGPFQDRNVLAKGAIDAHMFQDDDGQLYLYYVEIRDGFKILLQPMADPLTKDGPIIEVIRPNEPWEMASGHVTEGPFMLKRDGKYFLMYSGSGADSPNYAIGYATSDSPRGPFKKFSGNPIAHRVDGIYGPGHHCVVTGPDGKLWMVYHQKYNDRTNFRRFLAIDPIWFDAGVIHAKVSRGTEELAPKRLSN
jgi:xylan 1,4-beta-xylosidase